MKKKVSFGNTTVHNMYVWTYAYNQARKGQWHLITIDNARFKNRIQNVENILKPVLVKKLQDIEQNKWQMYHHDPQYSIKEERKTYH